MLTLPLNELWTLGKEAAALVDAQEQPSHILPMLKRILTKADAIRDFLEISATDIDMLEQCGTDLWNKAVNTHFTPSAAAYEVIATLREIGYRMTRPAVETFTSASSEFWTCQLEMASALGKAWTDCGNHERADVAFQDAENYDNQLESTISSNTKPPGESDLEKVMYQASCRLKLYMFRAEWEIVRNEWLQAKERLSKAVARAALNITTATESSLSSSLQTTLIEIVQSTVSTFPKLRETKEYHMAKLAILTKGELFQQQQDSTSTIMPEIAYFEAMENFPLQAEPSRLSYLVAVSRLVIRFLTVETIGDGLDVVLQRRRATTLDEEEQNDYDGSDEQSTMPPTRHLFTMGTLYMTKLYLLSEAVHHNPSTLDGCVSIIERPLKKTINDLFMDRQAITPADLTACQMILWRTGDAFYENRDYISALQWQLARCYLKMDDNKAGNNHLQDALECLSEAMEDCSEHCTAVDYLLKADIFLRTVLLPPPQNDDQQKQQQDHALTQVKLCLDKLQKSNGFTMDMLLALASTAFKSSKRNKLILQQIAQELATVLMKEARSDFSTKNRSQVVTQVLQILRWIVCNSNSFEQLAVLQNRNLGHEVADNIQEIGETIHQACDLICKTLTSADSLSPELQPLSEWFISAAWNLGLQCCEHAMDYRGRQFLLTACKLIQVTASASTTLDERQRVSLFMCIVARQLSGNGQVTDHQEILSIAQTLVADRSDTASTGERQQQQPLLLSSQQRRQQKEETAFQALSQAYRNLVFVNGWSSLFFKAHTARNKTRYRCCRQVKATLLEKESNSGGSNNNTSSAWTWSRSFVERFSKWTRLMVSTAMVVGKETGFQCLEETCRRLKHQQQQQRGNSMSYPESELYYLVVVCWNEGITWFNANDSHRGRAWCKLAFDLLPFFSSASQRDMLKSKLAQAYAKLTGAARAGGVA
ncbi:hypothetical protein BDB00DRAFT_869058 [Zychaea mexicana]|uniref:uncharacterized protein n=1 Tax=Zychaea mexicana TaxID=64656 RepID=UPI0022FDD53F|nr:uncharacterized protein BDB00DRAFT_869058 [Zychaea mexicana]KAI9496828.1 hypothetical protein BDB00DRAFT_869058 [Zychaea mexicana]